MASVVSATWSRTSMPPSLGFPSTFGCSKKPVWSLIGGKVAGVFTPSFLGRWKSSTMLWSDFVRVPFSRCSETDAVIDADRPFF